MAKITEQPQPQPIVHLDLELTMHGTPNSVQPRAPRIRLNDVLALPEYLTEYNPLVENGTLLPER